MTTKQQGFTLIELLVVVVIVAILFSYTTLAIRSNSPEDFIKEEAHRFERLTQLALEEAILRGEEYAVEVFTDGYRFLRFTENQWLPVDNDKILRPRKLPQDMELEITLEDTDIIIDPSSSASSSSFAPEIDLGFDLDSKHGDQSKEDETQDKESKIKPQIYLLSSGEISPEFNVRLYILGIETSYVVEGIFDGSLKTGISDL